MKIFARISIPFSLAMPGNALYDFVYEWILKGYERKFHDDQLHLYGPSPAVQPSFSDLASIVTNGGYFEGVKLGVRILMSAKDDPVPEGIRGRTYLDDQQQEQVRTWLQWVAAGNVQYKVKDDSSDAIFKGVWQGQLLTSDELVIIHQQTYAEVLEWNNFTALAASDDYNP